MREAMFSDQGVVYWVFAVCFVVSLAGVLIVYRRLWKEVNIGLPSDRRVGFGPPFPRSTGEALLKTNFLVYSLSILDQHSRHYPTSGKRRCFGIFVVTAIPSFIGLLASTRP
jgi:hypothetical protein